MSATKIFNGGLPTQPDIENIRNRFPEANLQPGIIIPYDSIANIIGSSVGSNRFRSVTTAWRKYVENTFKIVISCVRGAGFKVLEEHGKLDHAQDKYRSGVRHIKRSVKISNYIDTTKLEETDKIRFDRLTRRTAAIVTLAASKRTIELPSLA